MYVSRNKHQLLALGWKKGRQEHDGACLKGIAESSIPTKSAAVAHAYTRALNFIIHFPGYAVHSPRMYLTFEFLFPEAIILGLTRSAKESTNHGYWKQSVRIHPIARLFLDLVIN